ncbi:MAG: flagellar assembly protein FliH [Pseudomonadota bacterium]
MTAKIPGRIPAEEVGDIRSWIIPPVTDTGRILSSAEKEAREHRDKLLRQGKETIENVDMPLPAGKPGMSAKHMQEIYDSIEKDGFKQGQQEGFQQGKAEGYEAGRQQGLIEMRAQLAIEQSHLQTFMQALLQPLAAQDDDLENMLLDIICSLTQSVVQRELLLDSGQILTLVNTAVAALPVGSKNIRICVNPDDLVKLQAYAESQQLAWTFVGDAYLQPGGCRVETHESRVDYSVSLRLKTVLEQFLTGQLAYGDAEDSEESEDSEEKSADNRNKGL